MIKGSEFIYESKLTGCTYNNVSECELNNLFDAAYEIFVLLRDRDNDSNIKSQEQIFDIKDDLEKKCDILKKALSAPNKLINTYQNIYSSNLKNNK